ncbi:restriction endonuclease subunit S [Acidisphaera sp. L21]|uniref:restriction endonuclease subunit S n=1 Tax=Acidisphaera sp. L21 TaxID=1641851 RepID=UPI001C202791|nr:restriction endonuclease subunit S [Acidisphaera sp. L21]
MSYFQHSSELPQWVANPPTHWRTDWLKWHVQLSTERPTEQEAETLPYIANEDITSWTGKLLNPTPKPSDAESRKFQPDDVLFNKLRPYLAKVYHASFSGVSSGELLCLRGADHVVPRYLFYVVSSRAFVDAVNAETFGSKMPRADWEVVGHQPLPLPPLVTQKRIVTFLDDKTAQIDALTGKKQALLERLAEKRQSIITQAVTKGLNSAARMKDSGIDWLGSIPGHWEVVPFGRSILRIEQGWSPQCEERQKDDSEWGVLRSGCVNEGVFRSHDHKALPYGIEPKIQLEVHKGDLLMCRASGSLHLIGSVALVPDCPPKLMFSDKTYRIVLDITNTSARFTELALAAKYMREQIVLSVSGAVGLANNIPQSVVKEYQFARPPVDEQRFIVDTIVNVLKASDDAARIVRQSIDRLTEYRSALITAAVTGQISGLK